MTSQDANPDELTDYSKKARITAAWLLNPSITGSDAAATALDCTGQYIRDVTGQLREDGPESIDANTLKQARSSTLRDIVQARLEAHDLLAKNDSHPTHAYTLNANADPIATLESLRQELTLLRDEADHEQAHGKYFIANHALLKLEPALDELTD